MIGLGRIGGNMVQRLLTGGHRRLTYDRSAGAVTASQAQPLGAALPNQLGGHAVRSGLSESEGRTE